MAALRRPAHTGTDTSHLDAERGLTMVVFGLWMLVIFGFGAFALDISRIYNEHSELRNGADAAAFAIAADCGQQRCDGFYDEHAVANMYADPNARDGATGINNVAIDFATQQVTVTVETEDTSGNNKLEMVLAQIIGYNDPTVQASATVMWGAPSGYDALPLAFSRCEWDSFGSAGFVDEDPLGFLHRQSSVVNNELPPTLGYPYAAKFVTIYLHGSSTCAAGPSGQDLPGGFGWLDSNPNCRIQPSLGDWLEIDPGASPPGECNPSTMRDTIGTVQFVPYFDDVVGTGTNADYHINGFGALYVTGYNFGGSYKEDSIVTGVAPCTGDDRCIQGYMMGDWVDSNTSPGLGGGDYGIIALEMKG